LKKIMSEINLWFDKLETQMYNPVFDT
jgi:hypothetical protein